MNFNLNSMKMKTVKTILLHLWQLPQHLIAWCLILFYRQKRFAGIYKTSHVYYHSLLPNSWGEGISLGQYIFYDSNNIWDETVIAHEYGHSRQSFYLGPLYLIVIGLPSIIHAAVSTGDYYRYWCEAWADRLGGVERYTTKS